MAVSLGDKLNEMQEEDVIYSILSEFERRKFFKNACSFLFNTMRQLESASEKIVKNEM
jgi:hypothetical protein